MPSVATTPTTAAETLARVLAWAALPADSVKQRGGIDIPNKDRNDLAELFGILGFTRGLELGVEQGAYAETLCKRNPGVHLYCVDAWRAYAGYRDHVTQAKLDGFFEATQARLSPYHVTFTRKFSADAASDFPMKSLDFVYIDANHTLEHVIQDISLWEKRVRHGGIVSGHDFCRRKPGPYQVHVVEAVTAFTQAYHIEPWFIVGEKNSADGHKRDRPRSWFWVKP